MDEDDDALSVVDEYVKNGGNVCPFCKGGDKGIRSTATPDIESGSLWQDIKCLDCDEEWIDTYVLTGFRLPWSDADDWEAETFIHLKNKLYLSTQKASLP